VEHLQVPEPLLVKVAAALVLDFVLFQQGEIFQLGFTCSVKSAGCATMGGRDKWRKFRLEMCCGTAPENSFFSIAMGYKNEAESPMSNLPFLVYKNIASCFPYRSHRNERKIQICRGTLAFDIQNA
jgi:hypothetical protein